MRRMLLLFLVLLLILAGSLQVKAVDEEAIEVEVEGVASHEEHGQVRARELAISDGLRRAVERAVGVMVEAQTKVENYELIEDSILTQASGYVKDYTIRDEYLDGGLFRVQMRVKVTEKLLKEDLEALDFIIQRAGDPRVMVIIPEEHIGRRIPDPAAETEIIRRLLEAGFRLVDQQQVERARESEMMRRALDGDEEAYQELGGRYEADILVIGEAFSEYVGQYSGIFSCRARVEVRVVHADTGQIIAAHGVHESGADITELTASKKSLSEAGGVMADYLIEAIPKQIVDSARSLQVTVDGLSFSVLQSLKSNLRNTSLVEEVNLRDFSAGRAQIDIKTSLTPMQLAEIISEWEEPALEVIGLSGRRIELTN